MPEQLFLYFSRIIVYDTDKLVYIKCYADVKVNLIIGWTQIQNF